MNMRRYFLYSGIGMLLALVVAVVIWVMLQNYFLTTVPIETTLPSNGATSSVITSNDAATSNVTPPSPPVATTSTATVTTSSPPADSYTPDDTIMVRDLPLTAEQRQLAETLGLNLDQMSIKPETIQCARDTLGATRYQAILEGSTPTMAESLRLLGCL